MRSRDAVMEAGRQRKNYDTSGECWSVLRDVMDPACWPSPAALGTLGLAEIKIQRPHETQSWEAIKDPHLRGINGAKNRSGRVPHFRHSANERRSIFGHGYT